MPKNMADFESRFFKIAGKVDRFQVDIIDGVFAPLKTIYPEELETLDTIMKMDLHLMVDEPLMWLERCVRAGADRVFGHVERMSKLEEFVAEGQVMGMQMGLAFDIDTPVSMLEQYVYDIDGVMLLSVKAGASGQKFDEKVGEKIEAVRKMRHDLPICIDGGLGVEEIKKCIAYEWAEEISENELNRNFMDIEFAVTSKLFEVDDIDTRLHELQHLK
jgi:ribulose-phosphate 3-epimerase